MHNWKYTHQYIQNSPWPNYQTHQRNAPQLPNNTNILPFHFNQYLHQAPFQAYSLMQTKSTIMAKLANSPFTISNFASNHQNLSSHNAINPFKRVAGHNTCFHGETSGHNTCIFMVQCTTPPHCCEEAEQEDEE